VAQHHGAAAYAADTPAGLPIPQGPFLAYRKTGEIVPHEELMEIVSRAQMHTALPGELVAG